MTAAMTETTLINLDTALEELALWLEGLGSRVDVYLAVCGADQGSETHPTSEALGAIENAAAEIYRAMEEEPAPSPATLNRLSEWLEETARLSEGARQVLPDLTSSTERERALAGLFMFAEKVPTLLIQRAREANGSTTGGVH